MASSVGDIPLDKVGVRDITGIIANRTACSPSCISVWERRLGKLPWDLIAGRFSDTFLTSVDYASYFKILYREHYLLIILTLMRNPPLVDIYCRSAPETILHLGECSEL